MIAKLKGSSWKADRARILLKADADGQGRTDRKAAAVVVPTRALVKRIEFCYTPKHGSWLNIAENKLSAMTRQFL